MIDFNDADLITEFTKALEETAIAGMTSAWMFANAVRSEYMGNFKYRVPFMSTDGLGNYDRVNGYPDGNATLSWEEFQLAHDRGRQFSIDRLTVDETGYIAQIAAIAGDFMRMNVIPEIDTINYHSVFGRTQAVAPDNVDNTALTYAQIYPKLVADLADIYDTRGEVPLVIVMSSKVRSLIPMNFNKNMSVQDFNQGKLYNRVDMIDNTPILQVPQIRLKTAYDMLDGTSTGQTAGGIVPSTGALDINWMILPRDAPKAFFKVDEVKFFDPQQNQTHSAFKFMCREAYDCHIRKNRIADIRINTGALTETATP